MMKLKLQSMTQGGVNLAAKTVENTYITNGADHLINIETNKKHQKLNRCHSCLSDCLWWGVFIALVVFTVLYWKTVGDMKVATTVKK